MWFFECVVSVLRFNTTYHLVVILEEATNLQARPKDLGGRMTLI